ncbi:putative toxin-antitoxin system toxin component, PIN family [Isoptericola variabilis]|uniref:PIN domain-containing protein n=1 Tax=Isoptericola variabilis (strain 225) TaxID=743718 RepID=F6FRC7_ISOV2|nr:putative toxin-antitoxin system toxin component, PIN family [Isoptericola variabilis]AEG43888.1 protein of unknown function DUF132 [Isoptericola variabilis 225]TWH30479.1 putative PIN family toxin of toxin-antitoxin system [Isoptericola variabilis J7]
MRVFIDTNVLLSAALFPDGVAARAYVAAVSLADEVVVSDVVLAELRSVVTRKFPEVASAMDEFIAALPTFATVVATPERPVADEERVRDVKDRPILRAASNVEVDVLLTGDKDLLAAAIENPVIVAPADFLEMISPGA